MKKLIYSALLMSLIASSTSFAMEEDEKGNNERYIRTGKILPLLKENEDEVEEDWYLHPSPDSQIVKPRELTEILKQYRELGKPIGLAWACHSTEMPEKILNTFGSKIPAIENWISLDMCDCHIRMDATNEQHVLQVCHWLKENDIEVSTVAFTAFGPDVDTSSWRNVYSVVKKGGVLIHPVYFPTYHQRNQSADYSEFGNISIKYRNMSISYGGHFYEDLKNYRNPQDKFYQNQQGLLESTLNWIEKQARHKGEAGKRLAAKVYVNRIVSFKPEYVSESLPCVRSIDIWEEASQLFSKSSDQFTHDYISYFREYMTEIGFDPSSYRICSEGKANIYGVENYIYPQDGTYNLTGYGGNISLVVRK